jgi:cell division topological specificity factor
MMLFSFFRRKPAAPATAPVARGRLEVLLAHERASPGESNLLGALKDDLIRAIQKHVSLPPDAIRVKVERRKSVSTLRVAIDLPG